MKIQIYLLIIFLFFAVKVWCQNNPNYDETKVPTYVLPDPLTLLNGQKVNTKRKWEKKRRGEILELFKQHVYGSMPPAIEINRIENHSDTTILDGKARVLQKTLYLKKNNKEIGIDLCIFLPATSKGIESYPAFLACNFFGNHTIINHPGIKETRAWTWRKPDRGERASFWAIEDIVSRGYALVTYCYGDIDPDDGKMNGILELFPEYQARSDNWASIGAWAWGVSRVMDYLEELDEIDNNRVAVMGHSRLGKTALWAGATDERFAMVISNNSGCGGAALSRRRYGETVKMVNEAVNGNWFCQKFKEYNDNEDALPVDQHMLISLVAPRPVYVASAVDDKWCDPKGEFLACVGANKVYRLLGTSGLPDLNEPVVGNPVTGQIGYHLREGGHAVTAYDWKQYLDFADRHLKKEEAAK